MSLPSAGTVERTNMFKNSKTRKQRNEEMM
jgi:hypothetical protein